MSTHLPAGTAIRIKPREGKIIDTNRQYLKLRKLPNGRWEQSDETMITTYTIKLDDGRTMLVNGFEIEEMGE